MNDTKLMISFIRLRTQSAALKWSELHLNRVIAGLPALLEFLLEILGILAKLK